MLSKIGRKRFTRMTLVLLLAGCFALTHAGSSASSDKDRGESPLRRATFEVRHELKVMVPDGARRLRLWFALHQDDPVPGDGAVPAQHVSNLQVEAPFPYRVERDSEGNKMLYLEAESPREKELTVLTTFVLTRSEVRSGVDPNQARPPGRSGPSSSLSPL